MGRVILIDFLDFNLDPDYPCRDYLKIVSEDKTLLLPVTCGGKAPFTILSKTNRVDVTFHSDMYSPNNIQKATRRWILDWSEGNHFINIFVYYISL